MKFLKDHHLGGAPHLFQGDKAEGATPAWEFRIEESLKVLEQDPLSTMQKTCLTNYSSFLVLSGLEKNFTSGCDH